MLISPAPQNQRVIGVFSADRSCLNVQSEPVKIDRIGEEGIKLNECDREEVVFQQEINRR